MPSEIFPLRNMVVKLPITEVKVHWRVAFVLVVCLGWPLSAQGKTDQEQADALFQEGYTLYQRNYADSALAKFKAAAELGHIEAAYYAGNIIRQDYTYITKDSEHYYRQAAGGGDVYAMLRLGQKDSVCGTLRDCDYDQDTWVEKALKTALSKAEAGDNDAM